MSFKSVGVERIAAERQRQAEVEGFDAEHDAEHTQGELAMAAVCYAAPERIYRKSTGLFDPWPWDRRWDKRLRFGAERASERPDPATYTKEQRLDLLAKAGALIAAEIDRLTQV